MLTPSSNTTLEPVTTAMLADLPEASAHFNFSFSEVGADAISRMVWEVANERPQATTIFCTGLRGASLVDALDQPITDGSRMADDFFSGTRSAVCGGTTTVLPFACQRKGQSLAAAVDDYHRRAEGKAVIDYAFRLIVTDPAPTVLGEELPQLIATEYTSFKIYMTYDDLKLSDRQILDVLALARRAAADWPEMAWRGSRAARGNASRR